MGDDAFAALIGNDRLRLEGLSIQGRERFFESLVFLVHARDVKMRSETVCVLVWRR